MLCRFELFEWINICFAYHHDNGTFHVDVNGVITNYELQNTVNKTNIGSISLGSMSGEDPVNRDISDFNIWSKYMTEKQSNR